MNTDSGNGDKGTTSQPLNTSTPARSDSRSDAGGSQPAGNDKAMPNSRRVYVAGVLHPDIRVPFREITLAPTKTMSGEVEVNEPVRVYDTSGPWTDPDVDLDVTRGLPPLRRDWILKRGDVEEIDGRKVQPIDDGYLSVTHAAHGNGSKKEKLRIKKSERKPLRAKSGAVTRFSPPPKMLKLSGTACLNALALLLHSSR